MMARADDWILARLAEHGVPFRVHEHPVARTVAEAEALRLFPPERFLKTVAFRTRAGAWILAGVPGRQRVDYRKLAEALAVRRGDIPQAAPGGGGGGLGFGSGG